MNSLVSEFLAGMEARCAADDLERAIGFTVIVTDTEFPGEPAGTVLLGFWPDALDALRFAASHAVECRVEFGDKMVVAVRPVMPADALGAPAPYDWARGAGGTP